MARRATNVLTLPDGRVISIGLKLRGGIYRVQFPHPDHPKKYAEISTGYRTLVDAHPEAARIVLKAYTPTLRPDPKQTTWDIAEKELKESTTIRPRTLQTYLDAIKLLRRILPETKTPKDITPELAQRFARLYGSEKFKRGKATDAKTYTRSPQTVFNAVANLSIVWSHFHDLAYVKENPWASVKRPRLPKRVPTIPSEDAITTLFTWLEERYPGWELMRLFIEVKSLAGCRLQDLSEIRSEQLRDDILTITPAQDKTHRERRIPLPPDIASQLEAIKGETYLWERYTEDTKTYRKGKCRTDVFTPFVMYNAVKAIFKQYQKAHPDKIVKSHDLRKRAITLMTLATQSADATAEAIGIDPQTARKYYLDANKAYRGEELLRKMSDVLRPKTAPESPQKPKPETPK